jgi:hypothetical protein
VDGFTTQDHDRLARIEAMMHEISESQALTLKHQRAIPRRVAARISTQVTRKAAILIGLGVLIGSALGTAGGQVVRTLLFKTLGIPS